MPESRPDPLFPQVPDEYLREIGKIVLAYNFLESLILHTLIVVLLKGFDADGRGTAAFTHMAFPQKLDALGSLLRISRPDLADVYLKRVQPLLKQSQEKRNAAIHHTWYELEDGVKRVGIKARGELKITVHPVTIHDVKSVSEFITVAHLELLNFVTVPFMISLELQQGQ